MKNFLVILIIFMTIFYLIGSFVTLSFDVREWDNLGRGLYCLAVVVLTAICWGISMEDYDRSETPKK